MPKADWKKCAVWTAFPTAQTRESQPDTGNGSPVASYSTSPTSCLSWSRSRSARRSSSFRVCSRLMLVSSHHRESAAVSDDSAHGGAGAARAAPMILACLLNWARSLSVLLCSVDSCPGATRGGGEGRRMAEKHTLDALDVALLSALREHPRAGALELSRITGVARATVSARLQRLEDGGVVTGYGPDIDVTAA